MVVVVLIGPIGLAREEQRRRPASTWGAVGHGSQYDRCGVLPETGAPPDADRVSARRR